MITDTATGTFVPGGDKSPLLGPEAPTGGDLAALTLLDILPDRDPAATKPLDSWQSLRGINARIIKDLANRHEATE